MKSSYILKILVSLTGIAIIYLGLNVGLGGIRTLGWQIAPDFIAITDTASFNAQDSHIRFFGGVWFGVGVLFLAGGFALKHLRSSLIFLCLIIAMAGLFRLSILDLDVIISASVSPSLALELVFFPLLALWLKKSEVVDQ